MKLRSPAGLAAGLLASRSPRRAAAAPADVTVRVEGAGRDARARSAPSRRPPARSTRTARQRCPARARPARSSAPTAGDWGGADGLRQHGVERSTARPTSSTRRAERLLGVLGQRQAAPRRHLRARAAGGRRDPVLRRPLPRRPSRPTACTTSPCSRSSSRRPATATAGSSTSSPSVRHDPSGNAAPVGGAAVTGAGDRRHDRRRRQAHGHASPAAGQVTLKATKRPARALTPPRPCVARRRRRACGAAAGSATADKTAPVAPDRRHPRRAARSPPAGAARAARLGDAGPVGPARRQAQPHAPDRGRCQRTRRQQGAASARARAASESRFTIGDRHGLELPAAEAPRRGPLRARRDRDRQRRQPRPLARGRNRVVFSVR